MPPPSFEAFWAAERDALYRALAVSWGDPELAAEAVDEAMHRPGDEDPGSQVAAEVTTTRGDPVCMVAMLDDADDQRSRPMLMLDRPAVWTPDDGCPPLP